MRRLSLVACLPLIVLAAASLKEVESRALALKSKGDAAGALAAYEEAAALDPKSARYRDEIGFLLAVLNRPGEEIEHFKRSLSLDPRFAPAHYHLGVALWLAEDRLGSIPELRAAAGLDPNNAAYRARLG